MKPIILCSIVSILALGVAQARTPGQSMGNSPPLTAGLNNTAVTGVLPGMDAGRLVQRPSPEYRMAHPPVGGMNNAAVTGNIPGFHGGYLASVRTAPVSGMHRPVSGINNAAVAGEVPGVDQGRAIAQGG